MSYLKMPLQDEISAISLEMQRASEKARGLNRDVKDRILLRASDELGRAADEILSINASEVAALREREANPSIVSRAELSHAGIENMREVLREIALFDDNVGMELDRWTQPNGLEIKKISVPIGAIGIVFESRPDVTINAAALCIKSGNASFLRSGSATMGTAIALHECIERACRLEGLDVSLSQIARTADRSVVAAMLSGLDGSLDLLIPRGGRGLVERVVSEAKIPTLSHHDGVNHIYVHSSADPTMALNVIENSKMRNPSVCGAVETVLIDKKNASEFLTVLLPHLKSIGCSVRAEADVADSFPETQLATEADWSTEYLAPIVAIKCVEDPAAAQQHIAKYGSQHTEAIIAEDREVAEWFQTNVDAAIVLVNASTQFADGGEFGMGGEIGISTGKLHARGPVGINQLTSYKYLVEGKGTLRT